MGLIAPEMLLEILGDKQEERPKETRLIDVDESLEEVNKLKESPWFNEGKELRTVSYVARKEAVEIIEELCIKQQPTVEERQTGEWIECKSGYDKRDHFYKCSECGRFINLICGAKLEDFPYCHCGAEMKGEKE